MCCNYSFNIETEECDSFPIPTTIFTTYLDYLTTDFIQPFTSNKNEFLSSTSETKIEYTTSNLENKDIH